MLRIGAHLDYWIQHIVCLDHPLDLDIPEQRLNVLKDLRSFVILFCIIDQNLQVVDYLAILLIGLLQFANSYQLRLVQVQHCVLLHMLQMHS